MVIFDVPADVTTGGVLTLVVPLGLVMIVMLWAWSLRGRIP